MVKLKLMNFWSLEPNSTLSLVSTGGRYLILHRLLPGNELLCVWHTQGSWHLARAIYPTSTASSRKYALLFAHYGEAKVGRGYLLKYSMRVG